MKDDFQLKDFMKKDASLRRVCVCIERERTIYKEQ